MWSLTRPDAPLDESILVVDDRVTAATEDVLLAGVSLGMPRREAEALAPFAKVLQRDMGDEARRFEPVVQLVEGLVPRVEVVAPGLLFVPVAGAIKFYGGESALAERVDKEIDKMVGERRGGQAHIGVADGPFAARWAAAIAVRGSPHVVLDTLGFLSQLDLVSLREAMGGDEMIDTFRWLGITTLGDLAGLPRDALASRFGNPGVLAHRLASGDDRPIDPRIIADGYGIEMVFEEPLTSLDAVAFAGRTLSERLLSGLKRAGVLPHTVAITVQAAQGTQRSRVWRSPDPFTERALTDRVWWQLRAWIETAGVPGGIIGLSIEPSDLSGGGRQLGLLSDDSTLIETERALARAQALLGPDKVLQGRAQGGRMPAERIAWSNWGEEPDAIDRSLKAPWPGSTPSPSPALVPPNPEMIEVEWENGLPVRIRLGSRWEPVLTWSGPWRLSGRWWSGEEDADRFQLVTSVGAFLCVVVGGRSYLAGVYD
jgi:protein ImuB